MNPHQRKKRNRKSWLGGSWISWFLVFVISEVVVVVVAWHTGEGKVYSGLLLSGKNFMIHHHWILIMAMLLHQSLHLPLLLLLHHLSLLNPPKLLLLVTNPLFPLHSTPLSPTIKDPRYWMLKTSTFFVYEQPLYQ